MDFLSNFTTWDFDTYLLEAINASRFNIKLSFELMNEASSFLDSQTKLEKWNVAAVKINDTVDSITSQYYFNRDYMIEYWGLHEQTKLTDAPTTRLELL